VCAFVGHTVTTNQILVRQVTLQRAYASAEGPRIYHSNPFAFQI